MTEELLARKWRRRKLKRHGSNSKHKINLQKKFLRLGVYSAQPHQQYFGRVCLQRGMEASGRGRGVEAYLHSSSRWLQEGVNDAAARLFGFEAQLLWGGRTTLRWGVTGWSHGLLYLLVRSGRITLIHTLIHSSAIFSHQLGQ